MRSLAGMQPPPDQFYTGLVALAYGPLRSVVAEVEPYIRFIRRSGEPALEIGCGHGEPLLDLVERGFDVTGLDSSADMLALCTADAKRRGLHVELLCSAVEEFDVARRFRSIFFAGPTFQLVIDEDRARHALDRIAIHLAPGGRVLVPLFRPQPADPQHLGIWREHVDAEHGILAFQTVAQDYRRAARRVDTTLRYRRGPADAPLDQIDRVWSLRWYEDDEFEALATAAGLACARIKQHGALARTYELVHAADSRLP